MILQVLTIVALAVSARAGLSYSAGGIGLGGGLGGGISLGGGGISLGHGGLGGGISLGGGGISLGHAVASPVAVARQQVVDYYTPAHYEFKYGVEDAHTGDRKQQSETRVGDTVKGEYSLAEPDGTIRVVKYTADPHNGFNAIVSRIGHASHPQIITKSVVPVASHGIALGGLGLGGGLRLGGLGGH